MLALFHIKEVKISDYTAIQELITRDIKLKTLKLEQLLNLYCGNLFAKMLTRNEMSIIHMYSFIIRQCYDNGTNSYINRLSIHNKTFLVSKN